ncbi:MAG: hypothetical protein ACHP8A_18335, partial [Terriglobales bacterium]
MRCAPVVFVPAPIYGLSFRWLLPETPGENSRRVFDFDDFRVTPHYPAKSPLDDILGKVLPGTDEYVTEKYAIEIMRIFDEWGQGLKTAPPAVGILAKHLHASLEAGSLVPAQQSTLRTGDGIEVFRSRFAANVVRGRERFLEEIKTYFALMSRVELAEFEMTAIEEVAGSSPMVRSEIRYDLVGMAKDGRREERVGHWLTQWSRDSANEWRV